MSNSRKKKTSCKRHWRWHWHCCQAGEAISWQPTSNRSSLNTGGFSTDQQHDHNTNDLFSLFTPFQFHRSLFNWCSLEKSMSNDNLKVLFSIGSLLFRAPQLRSLLEKSRSVPVSCRSKSVKAGNFGSSDYYRGMHVIHILVLVRVLFSPFITRRW